MVREHLQKLDVNRSHEPWRSGVSAERRNSWEQQPAALCRDAATRRRLTKSEHLQNLDVSWGHEPGRRLQSGTGFQPVSSEQARCLCHFLRFMGRFIEIWPAPLIA